MSRSIGSANSCSRPLHDGTPCFAALRGSLKPNGFTPSGVHLNDRHEHACHLGVGQVYEVGAFGRLGDTQHLKAHRARHAALGGQRVVRERRARIELEDLDLWGKGRTRRGEHLHARIELEDLDLQSRAIKGNQGQSRAIKGNQELEDLDLQRASRVISNHSDVEPACGHPARACDEPRVDVTKLVDVTNHESR